MPMDLASPAERSLSTQERVLDLDQNPGRLAFQSPQKRCSVAPGQWHLTFAIFSSGATSPPSLGELVSRAVSKDSKQAHCFCPAQGECVCVWELEEPMRVTSVALHGR